MRPCGFLFRDCEHLWREVDASHAACAGGKKCFCEVARAARDIHDIILCGESREANRGTPPSLIEPKRMDAIVEVVAPGNRRKHRLDTGRFVAEFMRIGCELLFLPGTL